MEVVPRTRLLSHLRVAVPPETGNTPEATTEVASPATPCVGLRFRLGCVVGVGRGPWPAACRGKGRPSEATSKLRKARMPIMLRSRFRKAFFFIALS
jgi:hypothetical protein